MQLSESAGSWDGTIHCILVAEVIKTGVWRYQTSVAQVLRSGVWRN